jgi:hypothetical protein
VFELSEDAGATTVIKLACNFLLALAMAAMAETLTAVGLMRPQNASAFNLSAEPAALRDRYGRTAATHRANRLAMRRR